MKVKRSERLIDMTHYLMEHPRELVSLTFFADRFQSAKSSISEDLVIVKETFELRGVGTLQTVPGAAGGVKYIPGIKRKHAEELIGSLRTNVSHSDRLLPGGYLFMTDILGDIHLMNHVGKLFAAAFADQEIDMIMTVATKGIGIAHAAARYLGVPVVVARRDSKVTEGSTVSINYVSGSSKRIQTMVLSKRSIAQGARVLIVDDFMRAGGTAAGMINLLEEFSAKAVGVGIFIESEYSEERLVDNWISLLNLTGVDEKGKTIQVKTGNYFDKVQSFLDDKK
ncbi:pur operon repressor [Jeotgalibacillus proteolyticus]|uniref:Pur operon repressor n=1 Tax=Jeotgalibacillus proteolyticus TaxID=2082395 RepID=A0A2S5G6B9_9BACL|nr:pur operon repressor [Jeotgalibacillus proteolyticus]PPA68527.1 pur operon repressor [Jeotgalibacillus proteolyticus]